MLLPVRWASLLVRSALIWLPIAAAVTGLAGLGYTLAQKDIRTGANDAPTALVGDAATRLNAGAAPASVLPAGSAEDLAGSLEPFVLVYDTAGHLLAGSATLNGQPPDYPVGVLNDAHRSGMDRVTWQPEPNVREATIAVPWQGGTVVAGQSLRLAESRIDNLGLVALAGWLATLAAAAVAALVATGVHDWLHAVALLPGGG